MFLQGVWRSEGSPDAKAMQCSAVQYNTMQCNAMQCSAMQCNAVQCNARERGTIGGGWTKISGAKRMRSLGRRPYNRNGGLLGSGSCSGRDKAQKEDPGGHQWLDQDI